MPGISARKGKVIMLRGDRESSATTGVRSAGACRTAAASRIAHRVVRSSGRRAPGTGPSRRWACNSPACESVACPAGWPGAAGERWPAPRASRPGWRRRRRSRCRLARARSGRPGLKMHGQSWIQWRTPERERPSGEPARIGMRLLIPE